MEIIVNPDGGMTAGVEIAADRMTTVLVDLAGRLRAERSAPVDGGDPQHVTPLLVEEIEAVRRSRSEEHTSELQSLMRISYAVFCLKKKKNQRNKQTYSLYKHKKAES